MIPNLNNNREEFHEPPIVCQLTSFYQIAHNKIKKFPKHERYSIGEKIENNLIDCLEISISTNIATKYEKEKYLVKLGAKVDILKILFRLSLNLNFIDAKDYIDSEKRLQEIGKMVGGWIKYSRNNK